MELPLSYVLRSLRGTLKLLRKHLNPSWKKTSQQGEWKSDKKRIAPKPTKEGIEKMKATKALLPKRQCPKCKRELLFGMFDTYGHGPSCTKTPIDPNHVPNPNRSKAYSGVPKPTGTCPKCGKTMSKSNLSRFHGKKGEKCKNPKINNQYEE
jgi:ssDNA-binding Zn-finger/Zn-ribbon topoisomerase 1